MFSVSVYRLEPIPSMWPTQAFIHSSDMNSNFWIPPDPNKVNILHENMVFAPFAAHSIASVNWRSSKSVKDGHLWICTKKILRPSILKSTAHGWIFSLNLTPHAYRPGSSATISATPAITMYLTLSRWCGCHGLLTPCGTFSIPFSDVSLFLTVLTTIASNDTCTDAKDYCICLSDQVTFVI